MKTKKSNVTYKNLDDNQRASLMMLIGLFLIVYSIICVTEGPGKYFRFPLTYLFGSYGVIYLIPILFIGFYMLIKRKPMEIFSKIQNVVFALFLFNLLILASINSHVDFDFLGSFKAYNDDFFEYFHVGDITGISQTGGGLIGYVFVGIINSFAHMNTNNTGKIVATVVVAIITGGLFIILMTPFILKLINFIKVKQSKKIAKKPKKTKKQKNIDDDVKFELEKEKTPVNTNNDDLIEEQEVSISGNNYEYRSVIKEDNKNHLKKMISCFDDEIYNTNSNQATQNIPTNDNRNSFFANNDIFNDFKNDEKVVITSEKEDQIQNVTIKEEPKLEEVVIEKKENPYIVNNTVNSNVQVEETSAKMSIEKQKEERVIETKNIEETKPTISLSSVSYELPPLYLLKEAVDNGANARNEEYARMKADILTNKMKELNVDAQITNYVVGPSVTRYEITLAAGVRVNTFVNLQEDFKLALGVNSIRIEAPIPGKSAIGIEVPNAFRAMVSMKEIISNLPNKKQKLYVPVGKDIGGQPISVGICDMPHCLISGATNSGKSVCANSIIVSLLMNYKPSEVRMIMVDPKRVEMLFYVDIPHLLCPIITDSNKALVALDKLCKRMMERFDMFAKVGAKNIATYNEMMVANDKEKMPFILLFVDEFAELMLTKKASMVEERIQKLVQLGRAAGIHLVLCTQRPDVNVITGTIKSNIPCRMTFRLSSLADSRTVIDVGGAEKLLNNGDMLLLTPDYTGLRRVQGVYVSDKEISDIVEYCKKQLPPQYDPEFADLRTEEEIAKERSMINDLAGLAKENKSSSDDALYEDIKAYVISEGKASGSLIQRKFSLGYNKAARMVDRLEEEGIVGPENGSKGREVLVNNNVKNIDDNEVEEETIDEEE